MRDLPGEIGYSVVAGSRLYGVATETSDKDFRGFYDAPEINLSRSGRNPVVEWKEDGEEYVYYSMRHFLALLEKGSPNTIELLFVPESLIQFCGNEAREIRRNKDLFVTKQAVRNMLSMAKGQCENFEKNVIQNRDYMPTVPINFKAMYHAVRLLEQVWMIKSFGEIHFPLAPDICVTLQNIRTGRYLPETLSSIFLRQLDAMENMAYTVDLPESCDPAKVDELYWRLISKDTIRFLEKKV
jgi:predicted nucleotidyltransferase